jgi:hypothetical protein
MAGLGKTRSGASYGPKPRSSRSVREHEGRVPQPGVPLGPRNTQPLAPVYPHPSSPTAPNSQFKIPGLHELADILTPGPTAHEIALSALTLGVKPKTPASTASSAVSDIKHTVSDLGKDTADLARLPKQRVDSFLGRKTLGTPTVGRILSAAKRGRVRVNRKGQLTLPPERRAVQKLGAARQRVAQSRGGIEGITHPGEAKQFAQYLAKYTGLDPKFVGAWVQAEGGGFAAGGQAGRNNWLGVGYPGHQTPFSQSSYFNGDAKTAAKATADWMKGLIGHQEFGYGASPGIKAIIPTAAHKGPQAALQALAASGWGTNVSSVVQNLPMISTSAPNPKVLADFKLATVKAKRLGIPTKVAPARDLEHGPGRVVYVRADAQGMVHWAEDLIGTQEGTARQVHWAAKFGLGSGPWCANFVSNGLARRGVALPPNPNFVPSYETEWTGGRNIGTDLARAKPGDLIAYSGEHIALYVGHGEVVSGNYGNEVARGPVDGGPAPVSAILRPNYKGGKIAVQESTMLPGSSFPEGAVGVAAPAGAAVGGSGGAREAVAGSAGLGQVPISPLLSTMSPLPASFQRFQLGAEPEEEGGGSVEGTIAGLLRRRRLS